MCPEWSSNPSSTEAQDLLSIASSSESDTSIFDKAIDDLCRRGVTHISFKGVDFSSLREVSNDKELVLQGLDFKSIGVNFNDCDLGDGGFYIADCVFGSLLSFDNAQFGEGDVIFERVDFQGGLTFYHSAFAGQDLVRFGSVNINVGFVFRPKMFNPKNLRFQEPGSLGERDKPSFFCGDTLDIEIDDPNLELLDFSLVRVNCKKVRITIWKCLSKVSFNHSVWNGGGNASISVFLTDPKGGVLDFFYSDFSEWGFLDLHFQSDGRGHFGFAGSSFPKVRTRIDTGRLGESDLNFSETFFTGAIIFTAYVEPNTRPEFSIRGGVFKGAAEFLNLRCGKIPDFTGTQFGAHLSLHGLSYMYNRFARLFSKDPNADNASKFRRLKELAENSHDHRMGLQFHADEMRASRWQKQGIWQKTADTLDALFDLVSDYGQSISRPFLTLVFSWWFFANAYKSTTLLGEAATLFDMIQFSMAISLPFLPASGLFRDKEFEQLFGEADKVDLSAVYGLMGLQGLLSFFLLFLIGLGLRNRFRI